jgi:Tol biopolymer transport system component
VVRRVLVIGLLAACGRVAFDARVGDGGGDVGGGDAGPRVCGPFGAPVELPGPVNVTNDDEWSPEISKDGLTLYWYCFRAGGPGAPDIWRATRSSTDQSFSAPAAMLDLSSPAIDHAPSLSDDELVIAFESERDGVPELYVATRANKTDSFTTFVRQVDIGSPSIEDSPEISGDGLRLVFHSNRGASNDLYAASRIDRSSQFGNLAPITELNTSDLEYSPTLSSDELEMFFSSDRPGGLGQLDIWRATRSARDAPFTVIENVPVLSSAGDDFGPALSGDDTQIYYSYDSPISGGGATTQIWVATRTCQ